MSDFAFALTRSGYVVTGFVCACTHYLVFKEPTIGASVTPRDHFTPGAQPGPMLRSAALPTAFRGTFRGYYSPSTLSTPQPPLTGALGKRLTSVEEPLELRKRWPSKGWLTFRGQKKLLRTTPANSRCNLAADVAARTFSEYRVPVPVRQAPSTNRRRRRRSFQSNAPDFARRQLTAC
jgi:hypothetical protein